MMRFAIKFETTYRGYLVSRAEYSSNNKDVLLHHDKLYESSSRCEADAFFTAVIDNVSKELFRIIESSSVCYRAGNKPSYSHIVFDSNDLLDISRYYADRN